MKVSPAFKVTYDANGGTGAVPTDATPYLAGMQVTVLDASHEEHDTAGAWCGGLYRGFPDNPRARLGRRGRVSSRFELVAV